MCKEVDDEPKSEQSEKETTTQIPNDLPPPAAPDQDNDDGKELKAPVQKPTAPVAETNGDAITDMKFDDGN